MTNTHATNLPTHATLEVAIDSERLRHWEELSLTRAHLDRLRGRRTHDTAELRRLEEVSETFNELRDNLGTSEALGEFFRSASSYVDSLDRLAFINTVETLAGLRPRNGQRNGLTPLAQPGWVDPEDPIRKRRLLADLELPLLRLVSMRRGYGFAAAVALAEASASTGELADVTATSFNRRTWEIDLYGHDHRIERTLAVPAWAHDLLGEILDAATDRQRPLLYGGFSEDKSGIRAAIAMNATNVFRDAGLGPDRAASFDSIRHTIARRIHDSAGTDATVEFLGDRNYERVLTKIGLRPTPARRQR